MFKPYYPHISTALLNNNSVTYLNLSNNTVDKNNAYILGKILFSNTTLKNLVLENSKLKDLAVQHITEGLKSNNCLSYLSLGSNKIQIKGVKCIANIIVGNNTIKPDIYTKYNPNYNIYCYK